MAPFVATAVGGVCYLGLMYDSPGYKKPTQVLPRLSISLTSMQQIFTEHFPYVRHCHKHCKPEGLP